MTKEPWAWTDDDEPGRLPRRVSYPIVAALSLALGAVVLGLSFIGWPAS